MTIASTQGEGRPTPQHPGWKDPGVITKELTIYGTIETTLQLFMKGVQDTKSLPVVSILDETTTGDRARVQTHLTSTSLPINGGDPFTICDEWSQGGGLTGIDASVHLDKFTYLPPLGLAQVLYGHFHHGTPFTVPGTATLVGWFAENSETTKRDVLVVDWAQTLSPLTDPTSPDYVDPTQYDIAGYDWGGVTDADFAALDPRVANSNTSPTSNDGQGLASQAKRMDYPYKKSDDPLPLGGNNDAGGTQTIGAGGLGVQGSYSTDTDPDTGDLVVDYTLVGVEPLVPLATKTIDNANHKKICLTFPGKITVYLAPQYSEGGTNLQWRTNAGTTKSAAAGGTDGNNIDGSTKGGGGGLGSISGAVSTGSNPGQVDHTSTDTGSLTRTQVHRGNIVTTFDSAHLDPGDYDDFVDAGGGIVSESGVYPNSQTIYIENISLSVTGSEMTVVQLPEFDDTALLDPLERIFGYIINQDGDVQPSFAGYVTSKARRMNGNVQEIVYTCKDLKFFLDQFYSPIIYKQERKASNSMVSTLLRSSGITNFENNLATTKTSVDYNATPINQILDFHCGLSGNYYYWVTKNGILKIDQLNGTNHNFAVPSVGTPVSDTYQIEALDLVEDLSLSRSKIVVIGGNSFSIREKEKQFSLIDPTWGSVPTTVNSIQDLDGQRTGMYAIQVVGTSGWAGESYNIYLVVTVDEDDELLNELPSGSPPYVTRRRSSKRFSSGEFQEGNIVFRSATTIVFGTWTMNKTTGQRKATGTAVAPYDDEYLIVHYAYKDNKNLLVVTVDTGNPGGTFVHKDSNMKEVTTPTEKTNDRPLMREIANKFAEYYIPVFGGKMVLRGLHTELALGERITITNTTSPSEEVQNLRIYDIDYNLRTRQTTLNLSTRVSPLGVTIDNQIVRANREFTNKHDKVDTESIIRNKITY